MNPRKNPKEEQKKEIVEFYRWLAMLIIDNPLAKREIIGLYSYAERRYVKTEDFDVENVYKMGYFYKFRLTGIYEFT